MFIQKSLEIRDCYHLYLEYISYTPAAQPRSYVTWMEHQPSRINRILLGNALKNTERKGMKLYG
jgi:hypothetical protein